MDGNQAGKEQKQLPLKEENKMKTLKQKDDEETTRQFATIYKSYTDPKEIKKRLLLIKREEIKKDKYFV